MERRTTLVCMMAVFLLAASSVGALAQPVSIDKGYEDAKSAEISAARLRLATRPAATGVQVLNEAESLLRQLKATPKADTRRKIAAELDLAVTRLNILTNDQVDR